MSFLSNAPLIEQYNIYIYKNMNVCYDCAYSTDYQWQLYLP